MFQQNQPTLIVKPSVTRLLVSHRDDLVDYADLAIVDLGKASTLEGRRELAVQVREAMSTTGFFYVINHGLTPAQVSRIHYFGQLVDQTYDRPNACSILRTFRLLM